MSKKSNGSLRRTRQLADEFRKQRGRDYFDVPIDEELPGLFDDWEDWDEEDRERG